MSRLGCLIHREFLKDTDMGIEEIFRWAEEEADIVHYEGDEHEDGTTFCEGCHQDWPCDFARENGVV